MAPHLRWMIRRDMPEVLDIEMRCFGINAWDEELFIRVLKNRNCIGMVAAQGHGDVDVEPILGFMIYELHKSHLEVLNFAVHPAHQREGVGRALCDRLESKLSYQRRDRITWMVSERNTDGHLFLRAMGYLATEILRDWYNDGQDAYQFVLRTHVENMTQAPGH